MPHYAPLFLDMDKNRGYQYRSVKHSLADKN